LTASVAHNIFGQISINKLPGNPKVQYLTLKNGFDHRLLYVLSAYFGTLFEKRSMIPGADPGGGAIA